MDIHSHTLAGAKNAALISSLWTSATREHLKDEIRRACPEEVEGVKGEATIYEGSSIFTRSPSFLSLTLASLSTCAFAIIQIANSLSYSAVDASRAHSGQW